MKKKILVIGLLVSVLSVAGYAYKGNDQDENRMMNQHKRVMSQKSMMSRHSKIMNMFKQLNLDANQRYKISIIKDEMRLDMKKLMRPDRRKGMLNFISENGFDKRAFKKHMSKMYEKMLDIKANSMEKIFNILTKEQIAQLKKNIAH